MNRTALLLACACSLLAPAAFAEITLPDAPVPAPATQKKPPAPAVTAFSDRLVLGNKDVFHGNFLAFSKADGIAWRHPDCATPFQLKTDNLDRIELNQTVPQNADSDILIQFNNGDTLTGKLTEYTPAQTVVETWFAGKLTFKSDTIRSITPAKSGGHDFLTDGFGKKSDWKIFNGGDNDITVTPRQLTTTNGTGAARELPFPEKFKLDIEFARQENAQLYIGLLGEQAERGGGGGDSYGIQINGSYVQVMRYSRNSGRGLNNFQFRTAKKNLKLTVCGDAETKTLAIFLNDKQLGVVTDPAAFPKGKYLSLTGWNGVQKFTNLTLSPWNGQLDTGSGKAHYPEKDMVVLGNRDQVSGQLMAIHNGKVSLKTEFATMEIPLERIKRLDLSKASSSSPKPGKDDVRFCFNGENHLTLTLNAIKDGRAAATSAILGECNLDLNAAKKLEFNLQAPFRAKAGDEDDGDE